MTRNTLQTFVGGLPFNCENYELEEFMSQFGRIAEVFISRDIATHNHKGYAFVAYHQVADFRRLFGTHSFKGKNIEVKRNMHNQALLTELVPKTTEQDIKDAIETLGYPVAQIVLGNEGNGVPKGSACVLLQSEYQLSDFTALGFIEIKERHIEINSRSSRKNVHQFLTPKDQGAGRRKGNSIRKFQDSAERNHAGPDLPGLAVSGISFDALRDQDSILGLFQSMTKLSHTNSEHSTIDVSGHPENLLDGPKLRKYSSSLKTHSKEYHPSPSKPDSFQALGDEFFDDECNRSLLFSRPTNSDTVVGSPDQFSDMAINRKLSSQSTCFYSGGANYQPEISIGFFTFPGRD